MTQIVDTDRGISYGIVQPGDADPNGVPIVRVDNIRDGRMYVDNALRVRPEIEAKHARTRLRGGEVLLTVVGANFGQSAVVPKALAGWNVARAVAVLPVRADVSPNWLAFCLRHPSLQQIMNAWANTTAQPTLNLKEVALLPIPLPPRRERDGITEILCAIDDKIEINQRIERTLEAMARALFKSWFVDFDPVRAKTEGRQPSGMDSATADLFPESLKDSDSMGNIPQSWSVRSVYDCATYVNGAAYRDFDFSANRSGLPIVKIAELKTGVTGQTKFTCLNPGERYKIVTGDILFSWSGNPDTSIDVFLWTGGDAWLNQHIFKVVTLNRRQRVFVFFLLRWLRPVFAEIARNKQTTGLGHVTAQDMKRLLVPMPTDAVLAAFEQQAGTWLDAMLFYSLQSATLAGIRDTLLPQLISGELRLKDAEKLASTVL
ncbi:restriction endonuclease subunit S [Sorangium sp. So ce1151]|uniref:restriction endonuclease subunit S n=1 Tax=Sorangium sp. So ce1151 TaxID=3133332 RepID=UPI003F602DA2